MVIPPEFFTFGRFMSQDAPRFGNKPEDWFAGALGFVSEGSRHILRAYIDKLIKSEFSNDDLAAIWNSTGAEFYAEGDMRQFFTMIRDAIDRDARSRIAD